MIIADNKHVARRLQELLGWADYIVESLVQDQRYEQGKREVLERLVEQNVLRELRELSWSLREKLHLVATRVEHSQPLEKSIA